MNKSQVYVDGSVYSPVDPYATALLRQGTEVLWVGSDAGAESIWDSRMERIELAGDLLTPAFFQGFQPLQDATQAGQVLERLLARGYGGGVFALENPALLEVLAQTGFQFHALEVISSSEDLSLKPGFAGFHWAGESLSPADLGVLVDSGARLLSFPADLAQSLLEGLASGLPAQCLPVLRLEGFASWEPELLKSLAQYQVNLGISLDAGLTAEGFSALSASAAPYYLSADALDSPESLLGWELARYAVENYGLSARAAFNALTKGVARSMGAHPLAGQLVPGAPVTLARWQVTELMVQTADSRVANWSTDPRARIPLLPVLEAGSEPELVALYS